MCSHSPAWRCYCLCVTTTPFTLLEDDIKRENTHRNYNKKNPTLPKYRCAIKGDISDTTGTQSHVLSRYVVSIQVNKLQERCAQPASVSTENALQSQLLAHVLGTAAFCWLGWFALLNKPNPVLQRQTSASQ